MNYAIFLQIQIFIPFDLRIQRLNSFDPNGSFPESRRKATPQIEHIHLEGMRLNHVTSNDLPEWVQSSGYHMSTWVWDKLNNTVFETILRRFNQIVNNGFNNFKQMRDTISWLIIWLRRWVITGKLILYISTKTCVHMYVFYRFNSEERRK